MPRILCPRCGQAYDVPGVVAVKLASSIATCTCGEWLAGSKAAVLARTLDPGEIREVDLRPYRVEAAPPKPEHVDDAPEPARIARSVRVVARGANESVNTVFTIRHHPLWIGRKGCHVELGEAELSIRHCSISVEGETLVVRDAHSHLGTYLDGQSVEKAALTEGVHLLRLGSALVAVEPTDQEGLAVGPIALDTESVVDESLLAAMRRAGGGAIAAEDARIVLVCVDGPLTGQEFEVPETGLVVGREGHVRVPDEFLSRRHFEVVRDGIDVRVRDLGSRNGTFLNTLPARNSKVHPGDEIRAGLNRFRIEQRAGA